MQGSINLDGIGGITNTDNVQVLPLAVNTYWRWHAA